jgi:predicted ATPase
VLDGIAVTVETILRLAEGVDVLATSRTALALGENVWPLVPLRTEGASSPATRLFADRARAARPDFVLNEASCEVVEGLCRHLDRLPLALELAAARLRVAPWPTCAAVEGRSDLLAGGRRTAEPRHRSLEALVEWSYQLLGPDERRRTRRSSFLTGPWRRLVRWASAW